MCAQIKSIVAFDLEVTSLLQYDGFTTKIMEMSFVACSVEHLNQLTTVTIPRVVHKLTICCNPHKPIQDSASRASGLDNFILDKEIPFDENSGMLIKSYLKHLQTPICLIAHNGDKYDFPILAKELKTVNISLPEDLFCVDSLRAFREIDSRNEIMKNISENYEDIELQEILNAFDDIEHSTKLEIDGNNEDDAKSFQQRNETTPKRQIISRETQASSSKILCRKRLSYDTPERNLDSPSFMSPSIKRPNNPNDFKKGYKLSQIYKKYYQKRPEVVHQAEPDAITLMYCIAAAQKDFIPFMNRDAKLFSNIKPLGT